QDMGKLTESVWGFLTICIVGPVAEEVMMRRIILRDIWQKSGKMWNGILLSALIFALIHINPAQVVFAFPAGIILGWLYCASGSLIVPVIIHIINNTISFIAIRSHSTEPSLSDPVNIAVLAACLVTGFLLVWLIASISKKKDLYLKPDDKQETGLEQEPLIEQ
ncbi:MAG: CPBP family intramembrane metalloprotease, partial [Bacteroidaceae bacterium]|nr:CPBP family intramembrane metalloprotease [Bacteroidaceae bacterium]